MTFATVFLFVCVGLAALAHGFSWVFDSIMHWRHEAVRPAPVVPAV